MCGWHTKTSAYFTILGLGGTSDLFSAKAVTSCKLANTESVITEQQAPCQFPAMKPTLLPTTCRPFSVLPLFPDNFAHLLRNSNTFYILSSNFFFFFQFFAKNILAISCSSKTNKNIHPIMTFMSVYLDFKANKEPCSDDLCPGSCPSSHFSCDSLKPPLRCRPDLLRSSPVHPDDSSSTINVSQDTEGT